MIPIPAFTRIYDPSAGEMTPWYINDHCFVQAADGRWHMFGITHAEPAASLDEKFFAHATAPDLWGPWTKEAPVMHADPLAEELLVWAPFVIEHEGTYFMYYTAGGAANMFRIHLATSDDLATWHRSAANPLFIDGFDARDPMVLRLGDEWVMYYVGSRPIYGGESVVLARTSTDLETWSEPRIVFNAGGPGTRGILCESPQVVPRDSRYYLFVCDNRPYVNTQVFVSDDPFAWSVEGLVGSYAAHCSEVVRAPDGRWCVSSAGWGTGGLFLADFPW
jgi:sucrose-6-phosphate hydrolase SacC (GH32 family)